MAIVGWNATDCRQEFLDAIATGDDAIYVPNRDVIYQLGSHLTYLDIDADPPSVRIPSGQAMYLAAGVVIKSKVGHYQGIYQSMFGVSGSGVGIYGRTGSTIQMLSRAELGWPAAVHLDGKEHQHAIFLASSVGTTVDGVRLLSGAGDGLFVGYVSNNGAPCQNITLENLNMTGYRNSISIISVNGLFLSHCVSENTAGTSPQAGLSIEPDNPFDILQDVVIDDLTCINNIGGIFVQLNYLGGTAAVNVLIKNSRVKTAGGAAWALRTECPSGKGSSGGGTVEFRDCQVGTCIEGGIRSKWDRLGPTIAKYTRCQLLGSATDPSASPIDLVIEEATAAPDGIGGVVFEDVTVWDSVDRNVVKATVPRSTNYARGNVSLLISAENPVASQGIGNLPQLLINGGPGTPPSGAHNPSQSHLTRNVYPV